MAVVFAEDVIEIAVIHEMEGRPCVNVWHMRHQPEWSNDDDVLVVEDFRDNWQDHVMTVMCSAVELLRFEWRSLDPEDSQVGVVDRDETKNTVGTAGASAAPPNVAMLVNKRTSDRPRGARDGRMFLPGVNESLIDARGNLSSTALDTYQPDIDDFYNGISDSAWNAAGDRWPVVLETTPESRAPGPQSVTIDSRRVTSLPIDPLVSTQRDRLR